MAVKIAPVEPTGNPQNVVAYRGAVGISPVTQLKERGVTPLDGLRDDADVCCQAPPLTRRTGH